MQRSKKTFSLDDLTKHQQRIRSIVSNINQYKPDFHFNKNYKPEKYSIKIKKYERRKSQDKLFLQNMSLIEKLQTIQPKINTKKFPQVNLQARQKRKYTSLSPSLKNYFKSPLKQIKKRYIQKDQDQIFQENIKMIEKIQSVESKIKCWQEKILIKSRKIHQKRQQQKRQLILNKFKQIQKQISHLNIRKNTSKVSLINKEKKSFLENKKLMSRYLKKDQIMKSTTGGQTVFEQRQSKNIKKVKTGINEPQLKRPDQYKKQEN